MNSLPVKAQWYLQLVMLCGAVVGLYAVLGHRVADPWNLLMMAILACQLSVMKIRIRFGGENCSMSVAFPLTFAALLMLGLYEGIAVAIFCSISQSVLNTEAKTPLYRTLFNVASLVLTVALAGSVYLLGRGRLPMPTTNISWLAVLAGVVTYWLANTGFISGAISLSTGRPFFSIWAKNLKWTAANFALGGFLAIWLVPFFHAVGIGIFVLICPLLYLVYYTYHQVGRSKESEGAF